MLSLDSGVARHAFALSIYAIRTISTEQFNQFVNLFIPLLTQLPDPQQIGIGENITALSIADTVNLQLNVKEPLSAVYFVQLCAAIYKYC